jgi:hypothetical protein
MEVCYWALLFMPLVILHHLLYVFVQLANKRGFTKKKKKLSLLCKSSGAITPTQAIAKNIELRQRNCVFYAVRAEMLYTEQEKASQLVELSGVSPELL